MPRHLSHLPAVVSTLKGDRQSYDQNAVLHMREGTITSVQANTCTITLGGTTGITGIRWVGSTPSTGRCIILQQGRVMYVLGNPSR